jgi:hypothetical protein
MSEPIVPDEIITPESQPRRLPKTPRAPRRRLTKAQAQQLTAQLEACGTQLAEQLHEFIDLIRQAHSGRVWEALGCDDFQAYLDQHVKLPRLNKPDQAAMAALLRQDEMSLVDIAAVVGSSKSTVQRKVGSRVSQMGKQPSSSMPSPHRQLPRPGKTAKRQLTQADKNAQAEAEIAADLAQTSPVPSGSQWVSGMRHCYQEWEAVDGELSGYLDDMQGLDGDEQATRAAARLAPTFRDSVADQLKRLDELVDSLPLPLEED